jgi:hypothetical protein
LQPLVQPLNYASGLARSNYRNHPSSGSSSSR